MINYHLINSLKNEHNKAIQSIYKTCTFTIVVLLRGKEQELLLPGRMNVLHVATDFLFSDSFVVAVATFPWFQLKMVHQMNM